MRRSLLARLPSLCQAGQQQSSQHLAAAASVPHLPLCLHNNNSDEQQQQHSLSAVQQQLRSLHVLPASAAALSSSRQSLMLKAAAAGNPTSLQQLRGMAGLPTDSGNTVTENTWAKFRTEYGVEKRNDLAAGMYALILVFSLSAAVHDFYAYPPRIVAMLGLVFFVLYRRKGNA